jgi:hypothetical protein
LRPQADLCLQVGKDASRETLFQCAGRKLATTREIHILSLVHLLDPVGKGSGRHDRQ